MATEKERPPSRSKSTDLGSDQDPKPEARAPAARSVTTTGKTPALDISRKQTASSLPAVSVVAPPVGATTAPKDLTPFQRQSLSSAFGSAERHRKLANALGTTGEVRLPDEVTDPRMEAVTFDGSEVLPELSRRDVWKAVQAPVQSREGKRSKAVLLNVIHQFAVANNPRYDPDPPDKARAHIYLWDVTRAMGCEIPHFVGPKELSLAQTVDWIRHEAPMRGWVRSSAEDAVAATFEGRLALAVPRDLKVRMVAIVMPVAPDNTGKPFCSTAGPRLRGSALKLNEALGVFQAEYFAHA